MSRRKHWNYYEDDNRPSGRGGTVIVGIIIALIALAIYFLKDFIEWLRH